MIVGFLFSKYIRRLEYLPKMNADDFVVGKGNKSLRRRYVAITGHSLVECNNLGWIVLFHSRSKIKVRQSLAGHAVNFGRKLQGSVFILHTHHDISVLQQLEQNCSVIV